MHEHLAGRRTYKVIGDVNNPNNGTSPKHEKIDSLLASAGNAPFHYACDRIHLDTHNSPVPWRCYKLDRDVCQQMMQQLLELGDTTKVPNMLAAADALIQVTWLPDDGTILGDGRTKEGPVFSGTLRNMEHLAAASAFIQSLLVAADSVGFKTYWSSGGPLRQTHAFEMLDIPQTEILLGAVFLFPAEPMDAEIKSGALADKRGTVEDWSKWCSLT